MNKQDFKDHFYSAIGGGVAAAIGGAACIVLIAGALVIMQGGSVASIAAIASGTIVPTATVVGIAAVGVYKAAGAALNALIEKRRPLTIMAAGIVSGAAFIGVGHNAILSKMTKPVNDQTPSTLQFNGMKKIAADFSKACNKTGITFGKNGHVLTTQKSFKL